MAASAAIETSTSSSPLYVELPDECDTQCCDTEAGMSFNKDSITINELLCFLSNKIDVMTQDLLVKLCVDFYSKDAIESAKKTIYSKCKALNLNIVLPRLFKRQGHKKKQSDVLDIIALCHEMGCSLPVFVARDLSLLPSVSANNFDIAALMHDIEAMKVQLFGLADMSRLSREINVAVQTITRLPDHGRPDVAPRRIDRAAANHADGVPCRSCVDRAAANHAGGAPIVDRAAVILAAVRPLSTGLPSTVPTVRSESTGLPPTAPTVRPLSTVCPAAPAWTGLPPTTPTVRPLSTGLPSTSPTVRPELTGLPSTSPTVRPLSTGLPSTSPTVRPLSTGLPSTVPTVRPLSTGLPPTAATVCPAAPAWTGRPSTSPTARPESAGLPPTTLTVRPALVGLPTTGAVSYRLRVPDHSAQRGPWLKWSLIPPRFRTSHVAALAESSPAASRLARQRGTMRRNRLT